MRKCHYCGSRKNLKAIVCVGDLASTYCKEDSFHDTSVCKKCYFELCSCEMDYHEASECLKDESCENHKESLNRFNNWDNLDYNYKPKKGVIIA